MVNQTTMAPKRHREPCIPIEPGTPVEHAILRSLGEMSGMFRDWMAGQSQNQNEGQNPELEQKKKHDHDLPSSSKEAKAPLDIIKEVHKSNLPEFTGV